MLDYKFNEEDIQKYYQLSNKTEFLKNAKSIELYFMFYQKNSKGTCESLAKVLEDRNINLYQLTLDYFNNGSSSPRSDYQLLEVLITGLKLEKIDLDNVNNINALEEIVKLSFFCEAKYVLENQFSILKILINKEEKYLDLVLPLLTKMSQNSNFNITMQKQIKNYVENLPNALDKYPQLSDFYAQLQEEVYLTTSHYHCYSLDLDCNIIANTNNIPTGRVNLMFKKAFNHIVTLFENKEIFNENNYEVSFINSVFDMNNTTKIEGQIIVKDMKSYDNLKYFFEIIIDELIQGIIHEKPYTEKADIAKLINRCCLFEYINTEIPNKEDIKEKRKIKI